MNIRSNHSTDQKRQAAEADLYESHRQHLVREYEETTRFIDKSILVLSGGSLGLSITLLGHARETVNSGTKWLLIAAWASLAVSMLACLGSIWISRCAYERERQDLDRVAKESPANIMDQSFLLYDAMPHHKWIARLSVLAGILFVLGIASLLLFGAIVVHSGGSHEQQSKASEQRSEGREACSATNKRTT